MTDLQLKKTLIQEGYTNLTEIKERGICGLYRYSFTIGLSYGLNSISYLGRYCYKNKADALQALKSWSENPTEDPQDPFWIKHKGEFSEWRNPLNPDYLKHVDNLKYINPSTLTKRYFFSVKNNNILTPLSLTEEEAVDYHYYKYGKLVSDTLRNILTDYKISLL